MSRRGPQVDAGNFTRVHNDLLAVLAAAPFTARELKVLLAVLRQTYGFNRTRASLTVYDFVAATGLTPHAARTTLLHLAEAHVVSLKGTPGGRARFDVSLNKYANTWAAGLLPPGLAPHFGGSTQPLEGQAPDELEGLHQTGAQTTPQNGHQLGVQTGAQPGATEGETYQGGAQNGLQLGVQAGDFTPLESASGAGSGEPKDTKTERHERHAPLLHARADASADAPAHAREDDAAPEVAPYVRGPRPGFADLVRAFLAVYERGGAMLPQHKYRELEDLCDVLELPASEVAAHMAAWAGAFKQRGRPVPRVATPAYFVPVIQERLGRVAVAAAAAPAKDPYAAYTGGT
jgi:phage replication O-like protein O